MPLSDHLNITAPLEGRKPIGERANPLEGCPLQALSQPRPFGSKTRNCLVLLLLFATVAWFWPPLVLLFSLTQQQEHYSHIVLIPFVSLYTLYLKRTAILSSGEWSPWIGLLVMGIGGWVYWSYGTDALSGDQLVLSIMSFVVTLWGAFLFSFGMSVCRIAAFGLLILIFIVPFPAVILDAIIGFLQRNSAEATAILFSVLGIPVFREGFVFSLSSFTIHVAEECSGIRSFLSLLIASLVVGHLFLMSFWAKLGLVSIVIPLAIIKNAFRIVGLALLANYVDPSFITDSVLHRSGGIPLSVLALAVIFCFVWLLRKVEKRFGYGSLDGLRARPHIS
ncbi:MAG: exosortase/archaeosortase family protein [Nitrospira sp.]|nr:exosortase/archaeosortase family protein [Nitrospira sp.]